MKKTILFFENIIFEEISKKNYQDKTEINYMFCHITKLAC